MSNDVVATDFRCSVGSVEFSLGGCDRQTLQDILQFLCDVRQNRVPGPLAATWKGERAVYELRRMDDGEVDSGKGRGLFDSGSKGTPVEESSAGPGVRCGLGHGSTKCASEQPDRFQGGTGNDDAIHGEESVPKGSASRAGGRDGVRAGGSTSGVAGVDLKQQTCETLPFVTIVRGQDRGPRYEYNKAQREKRKARKLEDKAGKMAANWRAPVRTAEEQKLHELKVKRQIIQEERKLKKLESPEQMVEDAMRQIAFAEKCAKVANDSKVAAWAADLASASAESIARSSGTFGKSGTVPAKESKEEEKKKENQKEKGRFAPRMYGSREIPLEDLLRGVDSVSGRSIRSDGTPYTLGAARAWVSRYSHLKGLQGGNKSEKQMATESNISVDEVRKYFRLKREFSL